LLVADNPQRREDIDNYAPRPVGTKRPNGRGLFDMSGNVWEWCSSRYWPYLYDANDGRETGQSREGKGVPQSRALALAGRGGAPALRRGWPTGLRVLRGGGYADGADQLSPALRYGARPGRSLRWVGMRLARSVPPVK
jgi:formylglycine-generating enzyme required for sulfatase activity